MTMDVTEQRAREQLCELGRMPLIPYHWHGAVLLAIHGPVVSGVSLAHR